MTFFDQLFDRLFSQKSKPGGVLLHEVIERSAEFNTRFESWKRSYKSRDLLSEVSQSYTARIAGLEKQPFVHILKDKYSNGFAISYSEAIGPESFQFLFDQLSELTMNGEYKLVNSDWKITDRDTYTETVEKHYLKPILGTKTPINQQFGNVLIEHILIDQKPSYIRYIVNAYNDRHYLPPRPFNELLSILFK